jgi:hypothetical protein
MKRSLVSLTIVAGLIAGCGNYSNEDVDFQLALPEQSDIQANLPGRALSLESAPEYYKATRGAIAIFNGLIDGVAKIVDYVRAQPPTARTENRRVWGPYPNGDNPVWQNRMVMFMESAAADPKGFHIFYSLEFRRAGAADDAWVPLLTGTFYPTGGVRRGRGNIRLDFATARQVGYPVDPTSELLHLEINYQRVDYPITVDLRVENIPGAKSPGGVIQYVEEADGAGSLVFGWQVADSVLVQALEIRSRWLSTGAGRSDARVTEGFAAAVNGVVGIDCWNTGAEPVYTLRNIAPRIDTGDVSACAFGAP